MKEQIKRILRSLLPAYRVSLRVEEKLNTDSGMAWRYQPKTLLTLEVQLAEHCNLNCAYCDHFSPLARPELLELSDFARDMARLSELFHGEMQFIKLMGGEPLLHPNITEFMRAAREAFPVGEILVVTNGVLLPSMPESFWLACREYRVIVSPTRYPVPSIDYAASEKLAAQYGVEYLYYNVYHGSGEGVDLSRSMHKHLLDLKGRQDSRKSFYHCDSANQCLFLSHGRMYTCPVCGNARHFIARFGADMHLCDDDSIDIYKAGSGREILEFLSKPIPFCRYCDKTRQVNDLGWKHSAKEISEWTD